MRTNRIVTRLAASLFATGIAAVAYPAVITVDTLDDTAASDGFVSLREAITAAETDTAFFDAPAGSGDDTINLGVSGTLTLTSALPTITTNLKITDADSLNPFIIHGNSLYRPFTVISGIVTFDSITFTSARAQGGNGGDGFTGGGGAAGMGGAIFVCGGVVRVRGCLFTDCRAIGGDGGAALGSASGTSGGGGGGLGGDGSNAPTSSTFGGNGGAAAPLTGTPGVGGNNGPGTNGTEGGGGGGGGGTGTFPSGGNGGYGAGGGGGAGSNSTGGTGGFAGGGGGGNNPGTGGLFGGSGERNTSGPPPVGGPGGGGAGLGGAIFVRSGATLAIFNCSFDDSVALGGAGGLGFSGDDDGLPGEAHGGAIFAQTGSNLAISNAGLNNSTAADGAGTGFTESVFNDTADLYGTPLPGLISVTTLSDENDGGLGLGSGDSLREAIAAVGRAGEIGFATGPGTSGLLFGELTINRPVSIIGNGITTINGAGTRIFNLTNTSVDVDMSDLTLDAGDAGAGDGGAIQNSTGRLTLANMTIQNGVASFGAGIANSGKLLISNSTISFNNAQDGGGGIHNALNATLTIDNSTISANTAGTQFGGAINNVGGAVSITNSTISGNQANGPGGGAGAIHNNPSGGSATLSVFNSTIDGNSGQSGGGIMTAGTLTIVNSTISNNTASPSDGGGIISFGGTVKLINSTISGNSADTDGGGISSFAGILDLTNSTITNNTAATGNGGGISSATSSSLTLRNSIVAANNAPNGPDIYTTVSLTSDGGNLVGDDSGIESGLGSSGDLFGSSGSPVDPMLSDLMDNGGTVLTHHPLLGSPAIDGGLDSHVIASFFPNSYFPGGITDARGLGRTQGSHVDKGAVENYSSIVVDNLADNNDNNFAPGEFEFREALRAIGPGGTITFDPALFSEGAQTVEIDSSPGFLSVVRQMNIEGPGMDLLSIDGNFDSGGLVISDGVQNVTINDITFRNFIYSGRQDGGALSLRPGSQVYLWRVAFDSNGTQDGNGGAASVSGGADLIGTDVLFQFNFSQFDGGAVFVDGGRAWIYNSTFYGNNAGLAGGAIASSSSLGTTHVQLANCTITENSVSSGEGGAIYVTDAGGGGALDIYSCTIVNNNSASQSVVNDSLNPLTSFLGNSIVHGVTSNDGVAGAFTSDGFNLLADIRSATGFSTSEVFNGDVSRIVDLQLLNFGSEVKMLAIRADGPAVNGGDPAWVDVLGLGIDGRSQPRVQDGRVDIGAFESIEANGVVVPDGIGDSDDGDLTAGQMTLREAIRYSSPGARIQLIPGSFYYLNIAEGFPIRTDKLVETVGTPAEINGQNETRIFNVLSGRLIVRNVTLRDGGEFGGNGGDGANGGGGGAGVGGAVFIAEGAIGVFESVGFFSNQAEGGKGGTGSTTFVKGGGGGGGMSHDGEDAPAVQTLGYPGGDGGDGIFGFNPGRGARTTSRGGATAGDYGTGGGGGGFLFDDSTTSSGAFGGGFGGGGGAGGAGNSSGGTGGYGGGGGGRLTGFGAVPIVGGDFAGNGALANAVGGAGGGGGAGLGGAVFIDQSGKGIFRECEFTGNIAAGGLGGTSTTPVIDATAGEGHGGAIFVRDDTGSGGGLGDVTIVDCIFNGNTATDGAGTGFAEGSANDSIDVTGPVLTSTVLVTTANDEQDPTPVTNGISLREALSLVGFGGTIKFDAALLNAIIDNSALGPYVLSNDVRILGPTFLTLSTAAGNNAVPVFMIGSSVHVEISDLTLNGGTPVGPIVSQGGLIFNQGGRLDLQHVLVNGAGASEGGGIWNSGDLALSDSNVDANNAFGGEGGGIFNASGGVLWLSRSVVGYNVGRAGVNVCNAEHGTLNVVNSTILNAFNSSPGNGGGILNRGRLLLINSTLADNSAALGGGLYQDATGSVEIGNSLFARNATGSAAPDIGETAPGSIASLGGNFVANADGSATAWLGNDQTGTTASPIDPLFAGPGNFGGSGVTYALLQGSPAIDEGDVALVSAQNFPYGFTDQRGGSVPRIDGAAPDIGAYETSDYDLDGISDVVELAVPTRGGGSTNGDGNNDGGNDLAQNDVVSFPNAVDGRYITLAAPGVFSNVQAVLNPAPGTLQTADFPWGWYQFLLNTSGFMPAGDHFNLEVFFEADTGLQNLYAWGPTTASASPHLFDFNFDGTDGAQYPDFPLLDHVVVQFTEGSDGDTDLTADNVLLHTGAIGVSGPTLATITSFTATASAPGAPVVIEWETAAEPGNVGFHLYRAVPAGSAYTVGARVTSTLVPAQGSSTSGAAYTYQDNTPLGDGEARAYFLEDIDASGKRHFHGPAQVGTKAATNAGVSDWYLF